MSEELQRALDDLRAIDFGYLDSVDEDEMETALVWLEDTLDRLEDLDIWFPEGDLAIRYFLTDPERSRQYLYGPTDIQDGIGLIEKLQEMLLEEENDARW